MNLTTCLEQEGVIKYINEKQIKIAKVENDAWFEVYPIPYTSYEVTNREHPIIQINCFSFPFAGRQNALVSVSMYIHRQVYLYRFKCTTLQNTTIQNRIFY